METGTLDAEGAAVSHFIAPTIFTGFFLHVILLIAWISIGVGCICCCCTTCYMMRMAKGKHEEMKSDTRGEKVMNTDASTSNM
jgi:hypothetical protein